MSRQPSRSVIALAFASFLVVLVGSRCATRDPDVEETMRIEQEIEQPLIMETSLASSGAHAAARRALHVVRADEEIRFAPRTAILLPASRSRLSDLAAWLRSNDPGGRLRVEVRAATGSDRSATVENRLELERAESVRRYLSMRLGFASGQPVIVPVAQPATGSGKRTGLANTPGVAVFVLR